MAQEAAITTFALAGLLPVGVGAGAPAAPQLRIPNPIPDPFSSAGAYVIGHVLTAVTGMLTALAQSFLSQVTDPVERYVLSTPDLLGESTLQRFWLTSLAMTWSCVGLLVALAGVSMIPGGANRLALAAREALGMRLAGGLLLASISLPLVAAEVDLANRMVTVFIGAGTNGAAVPLLALFGKALTGDPGSALALLVTATVGVALLVELVILGLCRWATLWLLVVLAPLTFGAGVAPGGAGLVRLWWRLQLATALLPIANAVLLGTYTAMFSSQRTGLVGALSGVAVLGLMTKLPRWVAGAALGLESADIRQRLRSGQRLTTTGLALSGAPGPVLTVAAAGVRPPPAPPAPTHSDAS